MPRWPDAAQNTGDPPAEASFDERLHRLTSRVLASAAARVLAGVALQLPGEWDTSLLDDDVVRVAAALDAPEFVPMPVRNGAESVLLRRIVELIRAESVFVWTERAVPADPAEMLPLLERFERLREALEPPRDAQFTAQLSSPVGLELVVEVAHDLRSPLTSILFLSEALRRGQSGAVNEVQQHQLGIIYSAALGLISIASDVMELARGGDRLAEKEPTEFSIAEIIDAVGDVVRPMAEEKGLELLLSESIATDLRVGFPIALSRVLLNLTTNALKFTESGSVELGCVEQEDGLVCFSVRDTGSGIGDDVARQLYEPFRFIPARGGYDFSESGLGLSICRKLVHAMGSDLLFETAVDSGTRFWFRLDLGRA